MLLPLLVIVRKLGIRSRELSSLSYHERRVRQTQRYHSHSMDGSLLVLREGSALQADWGGEEGGGGEEEEGDTCKRKKVEGKGKGELQMALSQYNSLFYLPVTQP